MDHTTMLYTASVTALASSVLIIVWLLYRCLMKEQPYKPHMSVSDEYSSIVNNAGMHAKKKRQVGVGGQAGVRQRIKVGDYSDAINAKGTDVDNSSDSDSKSENKSMKKNKNKDKAGVQEPKITSTQVAKVEKPAPAIKQQQAEKPAPAIKQQQAEKPASANKQQHAGKPASSQKVEKPLDAIKSHMEEKLTEDVHVQKVETLFDSINSHNVESFKDGKNQVDASNVQKKDKVKGEKKNKNKGSYKSAQEYFDHTDAGTDTQMVEEIVVKSSPVLETESMPAVAVDEKKKKKKQGDKENGIKSAKTSESFTETILVASDNFPLLNTQDNVQNNALNSQNSVSLNVSTQIDSLKKQLEAKERAFQEEEKQKHQLNNVIAQLNSELNQYVEYKKKQDKTGEELQVLRSRLHQNDLAHGQSIGSLQNELKNAQTKSNEYSMVMGKLAEENAKLKDSLRHINQSQHLTEDLTQKLKSVDVLNETLKNTQIALGTTENAKRSLEAKLKQAEDRAMFQEAKTKEVGDKLRLVETKMQQQPNTHDLELKLKQATTEKMDLEKKVDNLKKDFEVEKLQRTTPPNLVNGDGGKLVELEKSIKSLSDDKAKMVDTIKAKDSELNARAVLLVNFEKDVKDLKSAVSSREALEKEVNDLRSNLMSLQVSEKDALDLRTKASKTGDLEKEVSDLKSKLIHLNTLEKEVTDLRSMVTKAGEVDKEVADLRSKVSKTNDLKNQVADLKSKLENQEGISKEIADLKLKVEKMKDFEKESIDLKSKLTTFIDLEKEMGDLRLKAARTTDLEKEVSDLRSKWATAGELEKEVKDLRSKTATFDQLEKENRELRSQSATLNYLADTELKKVSERLKKLQEENKKLATDKADLENELEVSRQEAQVKTLAAHQQFSNTPDHKFISELDNLAKEKERLIEELATKNKKNEELRSKSHKTVEALQEAENRCTCLMSETETLRREVQSQSIKLMELELKENERRVAAAVGASKKSEEAVVLQNGGGEGGDLFMQIEVQKSKNDELRKKNWTMVSALRDMERKLAEREVELAQTTRQFDQFKNKKTTEFDEPITERREYTFVTQVKESCQWDLSQLVLDLDTKKAEIEILQSLLEHNEDVVRTLQQENKKLQESKGGVKHDNSAENLAKLEALQKENSALTQQLNKEKDLTTQVSHYKQVLCDTEKILFDLQASVEREEAKWSHRVNDLELEIKQLKK